MVNYQWLKSLCLSLENVSLGKYFLEVQVPCCLSVSVWLGFLPFFFFFLFLFYQRRELDDSCEWIESLLEEYCFRMDYIYKLIKDLSGSFPWFRRICVLNTSHLKWRARVLCNDCSGRKKGQLASYLNPKTSTRIFRISCLMISAYFSSIKKLKCDFFVFWCWG